MNKVELARKIGEAEEHLAELESAHKGEVAQFGDSWPGAQLQVNDAHQRLDHLRQEYRDRGFEAEDYVAMAQRQEQRRQELISAASDDIPF